jgi:hypothetical protein
MFTFAYGVSFGPIGWVLPSEVFPLSMRSKGVALSTASNWINNCMFTFVTILNSSTTLIIHSLHWPPDTFICGFLSFVSGIPPLNT